METQRAQRAPGTNRGSAQQAARRHARCFHRQHMQHLQYLQQRRPAAGTHGQVSARPARVAASSCSRVHRQRRPAYSCISLSWPTPPARCGTGPSMTFSRRCLRQLSRGRSCARGSRSSARAAPESRGGSCAAGFSRQALLQLRLRYSWASLSPASSRSPLLRTRADGVDITIASPTDPTGTS